MSIPRAELGGSAQVVEPRLRRPTAAQPRAYTPRLGGEKFLLKAAPSERGLELRDARQRALLPCALELFARGPEVASVRVLGDAEAPPFLDRHEVGAQRRGEERPLALGHAREVASVHAAPHLKAARSAEGLRTDRQRIEDHDGTTGVPPPSAHPHGELRARCARRNA